MLRLRWGLFTITHLYVTQPATRNSDRMPATTAQLLERNSSEAECGATGFTTGIASYLQLSPLVILMLMFAVAPLFGMFTITFFKSGIFGLEPHLTLANYLKFLGESTYIRVLLKSMRIALIVTTTTLVISYPVAFWLAKVVTRHKLLFLIILFVPYWVNYVIRSYAWLPLSAIPASSILCSSRSES